MFAYVKKTFLTEFKENVDFSHFAYYHNFSYTTDGLVELTTGSIAVEPTVWAEKSLGVRRFFV